MEKLRNFRRKPECSVDPNGVLESSYPQLLKWAAILTRGRSASAQDVVQELCLHFVVAKPDLSRVDNLDGYLYTCLRNIYLSSMARATREAEQFVSVADFDTAQFALGFRSPEGILQRQNDLRRICAYTLWRRQSSKSASYLVLLFFHGYTRSQTAQIASVPLSAIYNKVLAARAEVKAHLESSGKIRIAGRDLPPEPVLRRSPIPPVEFFIELRDAIFTASRGPCLPAEALVADYSSSRLPVSCGHLAHIVTCERCLTLLESHFDWRDGNERQDDDTLSDLADEKPPSYRAMMRRVETQLRRTREHRPQTISIAVNGRIAASHDVRVEHSLLSSRIDQLEAVQFIEVFTDQHVRLALIPVDQHPPEGLPLHVQRVKLSDERWLELTVRFDGLGLLSEAVYFDPALAGPSVECDTASALVAAEPVLPRKSPWIRNFVRLLESWRRKQSRSAIRPDLKSINSNSSTGRSFRPAWALAFLLVLCVGGFFAYRRMWPRLDAAGILARSVDAESALADGQVEHQILRVEARESDTPSLATATVETWKDPASGRMMQRLYDAQHSLVAAKWRGRDGVEGAFASEGAKAQDLVLLSRSAWSTDVSAQGFRTLGAQRLNVRSVANGYELSGTQFAAGSAHLESAKLFVDINYRAFGETLGYSGGGVRELRLITSNDEWKPTAAVPDTVFEPADLGKHFPGSSNLSAPLDLLPRTRKLVPNSRLLELQVAVLYRLNQLNADTEEPIEVTPTAAGRLRIAGTLADNTRKDQICSALDSLPDHQMLDVQLSSQGDLHLMSRSLRTLKPTTSNIYNVSQADAPAATTLRRVFAAQGLSGPGLNDAVARFSRDVLNHGQLALQNAYALNRLGSAFSERDLQSLSPEARHMWAAMAARHASILENELRALSDELSRIAPPTSGMRDEPVTISIKNSANFARAAAQLLFQAQKLNNDVGRAFASGTSAGDSETVVADLASAIPLRNAREMAAFAFRLDNADKMAHPSFDGTQSGPLK